MNPFHVEVKAAVIREIASTIANQIKGAEGEIQQTAGSASALSVACDRINALNAVFEKERDDELSMLEGEHQILVAKYFKKYLERVVATLVGMVKAQEVQNMRAAGKLQALQQVVDTLERKHEAEVQKLRGLQEAIDSGAIVVQQQETDKQENPAEDTASFRHKTLKQRRLEEEMGGTDKIAHVESVSAELPPTTPQIDQKTTRRKTKK